MIDNTTGEPVPFATIKVLNTNKGKIASLQGEFELEITSKDSVFISSVGYRDTVISGTAITEKISVVQKPNILEDITIRFSRVVDRLVLGNGAGLINQAIKCKTVPPNDQCMVWTAGAGAEFAEQIILPDSLKIYRISKLYIPLFKWDFWQPVFLQVYMTDPGSGTPGELLFRKHIFPENESYKKGKLIVDLKADNIQFDKLNSFFISISWDVGNLDEQRVTGLPLFKSADGICYARNLLDPSYQWSVFNINRLSGKETPGRFATIFAVEMEMLSN